MKTEIWYSLEKTGSVNIYLELEKKYTTVTITNNEFVGCNKLMIVTKKEDCEELSKYFLRLSKELNKLKELG